jgi:hypothetical protein
MIPFIKIGTVRIGRETEMLGGNLLQCHFFPLQIPYDMTRVKPEITL